MSEFDHGMLNLPLGHRGRGKSLDRTIDDALKQIAAEKRAESERLKIKRREAAEAEKVRPKLTAADVRGSTHVRDQFGWHKVVRVSAKSVTVETPYSWTERLHLDRVLEVRTIS